MFPGLSPRMWYLLKYGLLVVITVGIFTSALTIFRAKYVEDGPDLLDMFGEHFSHYFMRKNSTLQVIRKESICCLSYFDKEEVMVENPITGLRCLKEGPSIMNSQNTISKYSSIFKTLTKFNYLLTSSNIKAAIIEPSILYCMLLPYYRYLLVQRNFNLTSFKRSENFVTYGIFQEEVPKLKEEEYIQKMGIHGFRSLFFDRPLEKWMPKTKSGNEVRNFTSHIFYMHQDCNFHLVVFHNRGTYLWHDGLEPNRGLEVYPVKDILFLTSGAYEKFALVPLVNKMNFPGNVYIPSSPHYFLFEIISSRFLECDLSRARHFEDGHGHPKAHPRMSVERFNQRTLVTLHQLKTIFQPLLLNFWIWSGTMLGWYRQCDIIPYTTDVDFAAWASEVINLDAIIHALLRNEYLSVIMRMGNLDEALEFQLQCYNLRSDIFFMYRVSNGSWCSGHSPRLGYYFRYYYPNFTLCSAELLGEKVQVPCETEKVIETEYGPGWRSPVSSWSYEESVRNRGPNIYWSEEKLKHAYAYY